MPVLKYALLESINNDIIHFELTTLITVSDIYKSMQLSIHEFQ